MTVMIVDDSAAMRHLLREVVAPLTHEVVECVDGQECLDRFPTCLPDWTIMDVRMPGLDGVSTTREVHARWPQAKVILVTQFVSPAVIAAADEAGAVGCLNKDDLSQLAKVLGRPAAPREQPPV